MNRTVNETDILIVDDNFELRMMLRTFLLRAGYGNIRLAVDCESALSEIRAKLPEFIVLDVNLPDGDGFSLMKKIKEMPGAKSVPVLFLSARDKDIDRLTGLGLGADDYMVKPFLPRELLLRMGAILKRSYGYEEIPGMEPQGGEILSESDGRISDGSLFRETKKEAPQEALSRYLALGPRTVDFEAGTVSFSGEEEKLTVKELRILKTLAASRGRIVTFDNLCRAVWNAQYYTYENTVMVHIRRLREKIEEDPSHPKWLVTARGLGYKLNL